MNKNILELLKDKSYVVPSYLIREYKKYGIKSECLALLIYLINREILIVCDYKKISQDLNINSKDLMIMLNELKENGILEIKVFKNDSGKLEEYISLDLFYNKVFLNILESKEENFTDIYSKFESELGRTLSPIEYELINGWIECKYSEDLILEALKEAVFNGVNNFRYIDRILFEWNKKGVKNVEQAKKNKEKFESRKDNNIEVPDYDWLSNEQDI